MTKLAVENLKLRYGPVEVLQGVTLSLEEGRILVLLGASGSGKTTLLRAIAGFERPYEGTIRIGDQVAFDGVRGVEVPTEKRGLGLVFQSYALWPHRTVEENVRYALKLRRMPASEQRARAAEVLTQLGLGHLGARYPHQLSGGQQQRVAVARALAYGPPVILMDEPLSNLDARLRDEAKAWLRHLIRERRLSAIVVTHDQSEALALGDEIALLAGGRLEQRDAPQTIYQRPASLVSADFFGHNNRLDGRVAERRGDAVRVEGDGWSLWGTAMGEVAVGDSVAVVVRVEAAALAAGDNALSLPLLQNIFAGERWSHSFRLGDGMFAVNGTAPLGPGTYEIAIPPAAAWVFRAPAA